VSVPSNSLRTQISDKFITLGLLKEFGIVDSTCLNPFVGIINNGFPNAEELQDFISKCNVVVSTMSLLAGFSTQQKAVLNSVFSHFFVPVPSPVGFVVKKGWKIFSTTFFEIPIPLSLTVISILSLPLVELTSTFGS
jgi:hypothetical protein